MSIHKLTRLGTQSAIALMTTAALSATISHANATETLTTPTLLWSVAGFDQPESTLFLPKAQAYLVSNINGAPLELNGKGYISKVSLTGDILAKHWAQGLNAPKGMAQFEDKVYVADMQNLVQLDSKTGKVVNTYFAANSKMLNDVSVDKAGNVYVSDLIGGGVYRLKKGKFNQWIDTQSMPHPNGLFIENETLTIASWGRELQADFSTKTLGKVYQLPLTAQADSLVAISQPIGNLDGIDRFGHFFITNDWINGKVFALKAGKSQLLLNAGKGAADINVANQQLLVPMMFDNRLDVYALTPPATN